MAPGNNALSSVTDFLLNQPSTSVYDVDQKRGCLAIALQLHTPTLDNVLGKLHEFISDSKNGTEAALTKAIAILLDATEKEDRNQERLLWCLAQEAEWKYEQRLKALAVLIKSPSIEIKSLLQSSLKLPHLAAVSALCVLIDTPPGESREDARQSIVTRLDGGSLPKVVSSNILEILGNIMKCDPAAPAITNRLQNGSFESWRRGTREAVRRLVSGGSAATPVKLNAADILALRASPRNEQLQELAEMLGVDVEKGKSNTIPIVRRLTELRSEKVGDASSIHEAVVAALAVALDAPATEAGLPDGGFESLARRVGTGNDDMSTQEARLLGFAALLQTEPRRDAVLLRVAKSTKALKGKPFPEKLRPELLRSIVLGEKLNTSAACNAPVDKLVKVLQNKEISQETRKAVTDVLKLSSPKKSDEATSNHSEGENEKSTKKAKTPTKQDKDKDNNNATTPGPEVPGGGRFGLGLLELEKFSSDEDEGAEAGNAAETKTPNSGSKKETPNSGSKKDGEGNALDDEGEFDVAAYRAMLQDDEGGEEDMSRAEDSASESDRSVSPDFVDVEDSDDEGGLLSASKFDEEDFDFGFGTCGGGGSSGGLLLGGGSDDEEEDGTRPVTKRSGKGQGVQLKRKGVYPTNAPRIVFPSLIWRGGDILVVNKPADWICSASDVDKKKGRPLDPNEKCYNKGFKQLTDLQNYKFQDREKKYIHWWSQLCHNLDEKRYSTLFDEDHNYGLCHRLDRETSGSVLFGLTDMARTQMRECFHRHYVRKMYVCLVHGKIEKPEQLIDKNLEAMGQKARLHPNGKRARTNCKVLFHCTREAEGGPKEDYTFCTCEIAEGRMHQIRLHMAVGAGSPIVSEFYYQKPRQMIEDRRWCPRVFLHAYAVGFPDVSGDQRRIAISGPPGVDAEDVDQSSVTVVPDEKQEWHCCVSPIDEVLRDALREMKPIDDKGEKIHGNLLSAGLLDLKHENVHAMGTELREAQIDSIFFPWSSKVNPIEEGDLGRPRDGFGAKDWKGRRSRSRDKGGKGKGKGGRKGDFDRMRRKGGRSLSWRRGEQRKRPRSPEYRGRGRSWSRGRGVDLDRGRSWSRGREGKRGFARDGRGDSRSMSPAGRGGWRGAGGKGERRGQLRRREYSPAGRSRSPRRGDDFRDRGDRSPKRVILTAVDRR